MDDAQMTFWEHLDVLRDSIIRMIVAAVVMGVVAFCLKEPLFDIVLAPKDSDFITYRWLGGEAFSINLINTGLAEQFLIHMKVALMVGILVASPYILFLLFRFIAPALYENERRYSVRITVAAYAMFLLGIVVNGEQYADNQQLYRHDDDDESHLWHHLRNTCRQLVACHLRIAQSIVDEPIPPSCGDCYSYSCGCHHSYGRCTHSRHCSTTHLVAL